jgi:riboflavin transporter FmnP
VKITSTVLAGTAILAALVVVFDYTLKYSGLKVPFPWFPVLKFDFTGIPIVLSLLLFGLVPGAFTSAIAVLAILARSGDFVGSSMKGLAEFLTIFGMFLGLKIATRFKLHISFCLGIATRAFVMMLVNLGLIYMGLMRFPSSYSEIPLLLIILLTGVFNVIQGAISIIGGYFIYEAIKRRSPSLAENKSANLSSNRNV